MRFATPFKQISVFGLFIVVALWVSIQPVPARAQTAVNDVAATFETIFVHSTRSDAAVPNRLLVGEKQATASLFNAKDLTGAGVMEPAATFETDLPVRFAGPFAPTMSQRAVAWRLSDLPEEASHNLFVEFTAGEAVTFEPGFSAARQLESEVLTPPRGTQLIRITVTPEDLNLMSSGSLALAIDVEETDQFSPTITDILSARGDTWLEPDGRHAWWDSGPGPGGRYVIEARIEVWLKGEGTAIRHVPTVSIFASYPQAMGYSTGVGFDHESAVGRWTWRAEGSYRWSWEELLSKMVVFQGHAAPRFQPPTVAAIEEAVDRALVWLDGRQNVDGSWEYNGFSNVGVTAIAAFAHLQHGDPESHPAVRSALSFILSKQQGFQDTGAVYFVSDRNVGPEHQVPSPVYETSLAIMALVASGNPIYARIIQQATEYLIVSQNGETAERAGDSQCDEDHWAYGGWGYFNAYREDGQIYSDLSNTQHALMALAAAGVPPDHEVWDKARVFLVRCQHPDGGFDYQPPGGNVHTGRSHPTMSAAGVWGSRLLGIPGSDERIVLGLDWLRRHYAFAEPRMGLNAESWHFYWLWTATRAFLHSGIPGVLAPQFPLSGWYWDFAGYLLDFQRADGSWFNPAERSNGTYREPPEYATGLALLVLLKVAVPSPMAPP